VAPPDDSAPPIHACVSAEQIAAALPVVAPLPGFLASFCGRGSRSTRLTLANDPTALVNAFVLADQPAAALDPVAHSASFLAVGLLRPIAALAYDVAVLIHTPHARLKDTDLSPEDDGVETVRYLHLGDELPRFVSANEIENPDPNPKVLKSERVPVVALQ